MYRINERYRRHIWRELSWVDIVSIILMIVAALALLVLVYYQTRPVKTVDIKVPVATDQASYYPGQPISGIFFGDIYFQGHVEIYRTVFCPNYRGVIKTDDGDDVFRTQNQPAHLEGVTYYIGKLPEDAPVGQNCVIQFLNRYDINTPFGTRNEDASYYTQNFSIITKQRKQQLQCEAAGGTDCNKFNPQSFGPN